MLMKKEGIVRDVEEMEVQKFKELGYEEVKTESEKKEPPKRKKED